jgi:hypothetical protein
MHYLDLAKQLGIEPEMMEFLKYYGPECRTPDLFLAHCIIELSKRIKALEEKQGA